MSGHAGSPRVLRMTFELHVPERLRKDLRTKRIHAGADTLATAIQTLAASAFPWADRLIVTKEYSYQWMSEQSDIDLPKTENNTVA